VPRTHILRRSEIVRSPRVVQVEGIFDIPAAKASELAWDVDLPFDERPWLIGAIVGPSGSGKSTILAEMFASPAPLEWPSDRAVVDAFDPAFGAQEVTSALSAVGFSSPPSWLRPFSVLSNGEQFRAELARRLLESDGSMVVDEFTSLVDRRVAKVASAAVAKYIRRSERQLIVASCHSDILDWLQPDWVYDCGPGQFTWRSLQPRPKIPVTIERCDPGEWETFRRHHYLTGKLVKSAHCYLARVEGAPAGFASAIPFPINNHGLIWREHRTVVLPDFQGVGLGNRLSEYVASLYKGHGFRYRSVTSSPSMIKHRARSPLWLMARKPSMVRPSGQGAATIAQSTHRYTASFEYVGPKTIGQDRDLLLAVPTRTDGRRMRPRGHKVRR
jgi:GNAT superfamily N-acetyltransferase